MREILECSNTLNTPLVTALVVVLVVRYLSSSLSSFCCHVTSDIDYHVCVLQQLLTTRPGSKLTCSLYVFAVQEMTPSENLPYAVSVDRQSETGSTLDSYSTISLGGQSGSHLPVEATDLSSRSLARLQLQV